MAKHRTVPMIQTRLFLWVVVFNCILMILFTLEIQAACRNPNLSETGQPWVRRVAASGVVGNLLGGHLADRIGQRKVILCGFFSLAGFLPALIWVDSSWVALVLLVPIGLTIFGTYSPTIVLGQRYLPNRIGLSSGVTIGIAIAIGGGAAPIIGKIADIHGIRFALSSIAFLPLLTAALAMTLPDPQAANSRQSRGRGFGQPGDYPERDGGRPSGQTNGSRCHADADGRYGVVPVVRGTPGIGWAIPGVEGSLKRCLARRPSSTIYPKPLAKRGAAGVTNAPWC